MAAQPGWWRRLRDALARLRGKDEVHGMALSGMILCGGMLLLVAFLCVNYLLTGDLRFEGKDLGILTAFSVLGLYLGVSIRRDQEWAWWIAVLGWTVMAALVLYGVWRAFWSTKERDAGDLVALIFIAGWLYMPFKSYSDLKKMRRRKQAELQQESQGPAPRVG